MSDTRTALDALNELVTQKASSPFVLNKSWWRCLFRSLEIFAFMMSIISIIFTITSLMTVLFGYYLIGLAGMAGGAGVLWGLSRLFVAAKEADAVSETHWNEITNLITSIATIRPEMANELKPLVLCLRDDKVNTIWSEDVIEQLKTLMEAANAENKRETSAQQLNAILNVQTSDSAQEAETIVITDKELIEDKPPPTLSLASIRL